MHERSGAGRTPHEFTFENENAKPESGESDRSHEELVYAIKSYIEAELTRPIDTCGGESIAERFKGCENPFTPEKIIADRLAQETQGVFSDEEIHKRRGVFFSPVEKAWDIVAFERYSRTDKHIVASGMAFRYQRAEAIGKPHPEIITLSHPLQVKILDAMADACGLPHEKGQSEFIIPEKFRHYTRCSFTKEDIELAKRYELERERRNR